MINKLFSNINKNYRSNITKLTNIYFELLSRVIYSLGKQKNKMLVRDNPNHYNLEDLTPYISIEDEENFNLKLYLEAIRWGVINENVKNIAISGSFGTGKSTILNLFKKRNSEFKTLDINLGKFEKNEQKEIDIETSIVQQILYFEKKSNLKDSRFERITDDKFVIFKALFLIFWIYTILYLFFDKIYDKLILSNKLESSYYSLLIKSIFLIGTYLILKKLFRQIFKLKINKISFSDAEFVPKENDISIINKHIDELIYFFEKTETQIVFIEDIDRFDDAVEIFIKLRELNILINNSKDILQKVTFVYAVKDELFSKNDEKTKFFDLIVPIIPIIDYSNSNTQFIKRLKEDFIESNIISEDIIYDVAPYISDMRSLINIINEFKTYYKIKSNENSSINGDKLFALIILKNLYPSDFTSLQNKKGIIYKIFQSKHEFYSNLEKSLDEDVKALEKENLEILREQQENIEDLQRLYLYEIVILSRNATAYYIDNKTINFDGIIGNYLFDKMVELDEISFNYIGRQNIKFTDIEKKISTGISYNERKNAVKNKTESKFTANTNLIFKTKKEISDLKNSSLYQLFQKSDRTTVENYFKNNIVSLIPNIDLQDDADRHIKIEEAILSYTLLKVLISNKYVDENYSAYISLFYPQSITENDNNLKLKIIQDEETEFNQNIDRIKYLIAELSSNNFKKESILNFYILDYLLCNYKNNDNISNKLDEFINVLSIGKDKCVHFIERYIDFSELTGTNILFIKRISQWEGFWNLIQGRSEFNIEKKKNILNSIIKNVDIDNIKFLNKDKKINAFVNNYDDFLVNNFTSETKIDLIDKLKTLGIKFNKIIYDDSIFEIVVEVIEHNLYKINISNVNLFLQKINFEKIDYLDYKKSNYSYILKSDITFLKQNINNNINEYIEQVLLKLENNTEEEIEVVKILLANSSIKEENIDLIIEKLNFTITDFSEIDNRSFWSSLLIWEKIKPTWKNIIQYYQNESEKIDDSFSDFLNVENNFLILGESCINDYVNDESNDIDIESITKFNISLVNSKVSEKSFEYLVKSLTKNFEDISVITRRNRLATLIENNLVVFNNLNLSQLDDWELELFVETYEDNLKNEHKSFVLLLNQWSIILKSNISGNLKKEIFEDLTANKDYSKDDIVFIDVILTNFYNQNFHSYSEYFVRCVINSTLYQHLKIKYLDFEKDNIDRILLSGFIDLVGMPYSNVLHKEKFELSYTKQHADALKNLQQMGYIKRTYLRDKDSIITISYHE